MKKFFVSLSTIITVAFAASVPSFAATVDLPAEFSNLEPIFELVLKIVEFISKIAGLFS
ncbi:MAG: hypothetical protein IJ261_00030 [Clostridia bacterium]|nr:hypothetical protein [Clostridia bacterium]